MVESRVPIITLTTDFGNTDHYVASIKGAILSAMTSVQIVDVTHDVPPHDIAAAAQIVKDVFPAFPPRTVHVVVVDPGVGTARRPVIVSSDNQYFVGPDNGVFTLIYESEQFTGAVHVTATHYMTPDPSATFHGRDVFAPVAAQLARGLGMENFGDPIEDAVRVDLPKPRVTPEGMVKATVIQIDRFGNVITNLSRASLDALMTKLGRTGLRGGVGGTAITETRATYADGSSGSPFFLFNSSSRLEIAAHEARACDMLSLKRGDSVDVHIV
ncbi:MAG TPA: SAM-dependent chlorinase/fluorinase [Verrucomicrobiae bacterium]|nr:SAM-dependent chlorinase/fluorinase [Verrucomicrobiae bacterium]